MFQIKDCLCLYDNHFSENANVSFDFRVQWVCYIVPVRNKITITLQFYCEDPPVRNLIEISYVICGQLLAHVNKR